MKEEVKMQPLKDDVNYYIGFIILTRLLNLFFFLYFNTPLLIIILTEINYGFY
jgi:hypothetical protein